MQKFSREVLEHRRFSLRAAGAPTRTKLLAGKMVKISCSQEGKTALEQFRVPLLLASRGYQKTRMTGGGDGN